MADVLDTRDFDGKKLPTTLNVLTILSIIGSIFQIGGGIYQYFTAKTNYEKKDEMLAQMSNPDMPDFAKKMMGDPAKVSEMLAKAFENRLPLLAVSLVCGGLCLYGVLQMRKLNKQGYTFYVVGELLPLVASAALLGFGSFAGFGLFGIIIPILFVVLYTLQRKYLVN